MPNFTVKIASVTIPEVTLEIEADNVDDAREQAIEEYDLNDYTPNDTVITSIIAHA